MLLREVNKTKVMIYLQYIHPYDYSLESKLIYLPP